MKFSSTPIKDCKIVDLEKRGDDRGFFARFFCKDELSGQNLETDFPQINTSLSNDKGTLRGLHYQVAPYGEAKLVRCISGAIFDVLIDLRKDSPSYLQWFGTELTAQNRTMLYIPSGCAHGFLTLEEHTELIYMSSCPYNAESERVIRWNDETFSINWPIEPNILSDKDRNAADYSIETHISGY